MDIQARDLGLRRQLRGQLQLCVPQVFMNGPSYRPKKRPGQRVTTTTKEASQ